MHELPVVKKIMDICLQHARENDAKKIVGIELKVGGLSDLEPEWMQRYFDSVSQGTIAEGARLNIEKTPVVCRCKGCSDEFEVDMMAVREISCPACGWEDVSLVSGRGYFISNMAVI